MRIVRFDNEFGYFHCWDLGSKDGWWAIVENNKGRMITVPFKKVQFVHKPPATQLIYDVVSDVRPVEEG